MMFLASYLLKVIICSGILLLYYHLALRNKVFHQWNRFYLLAAVVLSITAPIIQINISQTTVAHNAPIQMLQAVQSANMYLDEVIVVQKPSISPEQYIVSVYVVISFILLVSLFISVIKIISIIRTHAVNLVRNIKFINTHVPGTPFSFFDYIFWNEQINLQSEAGQQIFQHELVHVKEKHSIDKLLIQIVIIAFWCNPFFWLIRKELKMIHEFIADKKAVAEHGTASFAAMILQAQFPQSFDSITNQFFQTSIKRRITMLTKIQNPRLNYISRILALPIIALTAFAFTLKAKKTTPIIPLEKTITVVIDAGHGKMPNGGYNGAGSGGVYEDDITLALAKAIADENKNDKIKIILTRTSDDNVALKERVAIAEKNHADLFISLHLNAMPPIQHTNGTSTEDNSSDGIEAMISSKNMQFDNSSRTLASSLLSHLSEVYTTSSELKQRQVGVYVLDASPCPAVILECGYITNNKDRAFIIKEENQKLIAEKILTAIEMYAVNADKITSEIKNTQRTNMLTTPKQVSQVPEITKKDTSVKPLYIVNGKEFTGTENDLNPSRIKTIKRLNKSEAIAKYGAKGKNGVVLITLKNANEVIVQIDTLSLREVTVTGYPMKVNVDSISLKEVVVVGHPKQPEDKHQISSDDNNKPIFEKSEVEASVDLAGWRRFLEKNLQPVIEQAANQGAKPGEYTVQLKLLVEDDGTISEATALNDPGYGFASKMEKLVLNSPKWKPAMQNDRPVRSYHIQPVTIVIAGK